jgi:hypothetical protein
MDTDRRAVQAPIEVNRRVAERRSIEKPVPRDRRKRGRPRKGQTTVAHARVLVEVYDIYCQIAIHTGRDVSEILRDVLTLHAQTVISVLKKHGVSDPQRP